MQKQHFACLLVPCDAGGGDPPVTEDTLPTLCVIQTWLAPPSTSRKGGAGSWPRRLPFQRRGHLMRGNGFSHCSVDFVAPSVMRIRAKVKSYGGLGMRKQPGLSDTASKQQQARVCCSPHRPPRCDRLHENGALPASPNSKRPATSTGTMVAMAGDRLPAGSVRL
jgi:hypothetical protein